MIQPEKPWPKPALAWSVVVVLNLAYIVSFIDRTIISLLVEPIKADLGLNDTEIGLLQGAAFGLFYTLMGLPFGWLVDRASRKWIVGLGCVVWCVMTALCGLANSFLLLFIARLGVGLGEAALSPGAASWIGDLFAPEKRARAMSVYVMGGSVGVGLSLIIGGSVIAFVAQGGHFVWPVLGELPMWKSVFLIVGLSGLVVAFAILMLPEAERRERLATPSAGFKDLIAILRRRSALYTFHFGAFAFFSIVAYAVLSWAPSHFIREFGWSQAEVGARYGSVFLVFGVLGALSGGLLANELQRRGLADYNLRAAAIAVTGVVPFAVAAPLVSNEWLSLALFGPVAFGFALPSAGSVAAILQATRNEFRGQIASVYYLVMGVAGLLVGPLSVGLLADFVFRDPAAVGSAIATIAAIAGPLAALLAFASLPHFRKALESDSD